jgi:hypothetical protein
MRKLGTIMGLAALALTSTACGSTERLTAPDAASYDEVGGGTYGSGGRNLIPNDGGTVLEADGGGTYGSGGKAEDGGGTYGSGGITSTTCTEDERGGGTYGSGGRATGCTLTEPTQ